MTFIVCLLDYRGAGENMIFNRRQNGIGGHSPQIMPYIIAVAIGKPGFIKWEAVFTVNINRISSPVQFVHGIGVIRCIAG